MKDVVTLCSIQIIMSPDFDLGFGFDCEKMSVDSGFGFDNDFESFDSNRNMSYETEFDNTPRPLFIELAELTTKNGGPLGTEWTEIAR